MKTYEIHFKGTRHGKKQEEAHIWKLTGDNGALAVAALRMWFKLASVFGIKEITA